ncbi:MAG: hypothetical protein ACO3CS_13445, partial [Alphaproteobacteria bacterium]
MRVSAASSSGVAQMNFSIGRLALPQSKLATMPWGACIARMQARKGSFGRRRPMASPASLSLAHGATRSLQL